MLPFARPRPWLLGHRGVTKGAPENTLAAFEAALKAGLDGVETDVQRSRDGVLVIHHDPVLEGRLIAKTAFAELRALKPDLPRLEEVFELFDAWPGRLLNLELKSLPGHEDGRTEALAEALLAWPGRGRAWVSSFDPVALYRLRRRAPELPTGYLFMALDTSFFARFIGAAAVHPRLELLTPGRVARWRRQGFAVVSWTANDPKAARRALTLGVDGLIGGDPAALLEAKQEAGHAEVDQEPGDVGDGGDQGV